MKPLPASHADDKKGHICPPSNAIHPADRWETLFIYSFICKFTNLHGKEGLHSPMDFEEALMQQYPNPVMTQILVKFVQNLKPQTRNIASDKISATVSGVLSEYFAGSERTVFWDDNQHKNINPLASDLDGLFGLSWNLKLKILRQLVELQLSHSTDIKVIIDSAWGITQAKEKRKGNGAQAVHVSDSHTLENLQLVPLGQDINRKRYWATDDSPRIWMSTNPWKMSATFQCLSSTKEEYTGLVEQLKNAAPSDGKSPSKKSKQEQAHLALIKALEERVERIDAELARTLRARKKSQQRQLLLAQAELRQTRTRRQTRKPDYVYNYGDEEEQEDGDAYQDNPGHGSDGSLSDDGAGSSRGDLRRSSRAKNGKNHDQNGSDWRGERRSTRLGAPAEQQLDLDGPPPAKRARTVESTTSEEASISVPTMSASERAKQSAAALKATETAVEQVAGKKRSRYWFYAVEPINGQPPADASEPPSTAASSVTNGEGSPPDTEETADMVDVEA